MQSELTSSEDEGQSLGLRSGHVQGEFAEGKTDGGGSEPSEVEETGWGVEALPEVNPAGLGLALNTVVRLFLELQGKTEAVFGEDVFLVVGSLDGADDLDLSAFLVG